MIIRAACHLLIGLLFGYLYKGSGNSADKVLANYVFIYGSNLFLVYTGKMSATLLCKFTISFSYTLLLRFLKYSQFFFLVPIEFLIVTREHFNRWYQLGPYYVSMMLIEIPFQVNDAFYFFFFRDVYDSWLQIFCGILYLPISYYLTGNLMETNRLLIFCGAPLLLSIVSQAVGFLVGLTTPRKIAVFVGPCWACILSIFGFCLRYADTPSGFKWLYHVSYFRAAFHNTLEAVSIDHFLDVKQNDFCMALGLWVQSDENSLSWWDTALYVVRSTSSFTRNGCFKYWRWTKLDLLRNLFSNCSYHDGGSYLV